MQRRSFLTGALVGAALSATGRAAWPRAQQVTLRGSTLLPLTVDSLQDIAASPIRILAAYASLANGDDPNAYVRATLGTAFATLESSGCFAVYATMVAFNMAPYGDPEIPPQTATLGQLLAAPVMTCGHYCKLTLLLSMLAHAELGPPDAAVWEAAKSTIHFIVWTQRSPLNVGYHSQLLVADALNGAYLLLDPTYGFVLQIPYRGNVPPVDQPTAASAAELLTAPIPSANLVVIANGTVDDGGNTTARDHVLPTMISGSLNPSHVYYDPSGGSDGWDAAVSGIVARMG